jgi:hypothetical protein
VNAQQMREWAHASPFRPFRLHTASGKTINVRHPEFVSLSPTGRFVHVWNPNESWQVVDALLVSSIETVRRNGKTPKRRKRS